MAVVKYSDGEEERLYLPLEKFTLQGKDGALIENDYCIVAEGDVINVLWPHAEKEYDAEVVKYFRHCSAKDDKSKLLTDGAAEDSDPRCNVQMIDRDVSALPLDEIGINDHLSPSLSQPKEDEDIFNFNGASSLIEATAIKESGLNHDSSSVVKEVHHSSSLNRHPSAYELRKGWKTREK